MGTGRGIDHVGIAARSLDGLAAKWERLGFRLTPRAFHQDHMGTSNRLAQFDGRNFVELIEVDRPGTMLPHAPGVMGFGAFNHDFLKRREGMSLIVFRTDDTAADLAAWKAKGLDVYDQFNFERQATLPDGSEATVRFELGFVTHPEIDALFYVCHNRAEEQFWKAAYQRHGNGAEEIHAVILCSSEPRRHGAFLSALFGGQVHERGGGIWVECAEHFIAVLTPEALDEGGWTLDPGDKAVAAGLHIVSAPLAGEIVPAGAVGGAFIKWI